MSGMTQRKKRNRLDSFSQTINEGIRQLCKETHVTTYDLGKAIGKSQSYAALRYAGDSNWDTGDLEAIARLLGYTNAFGLLTAIRNGDKPIRVQTIPQFSDRQTQIEQQAFTAAAYQRTRQQKRRDQLGGAWRQDEDNGNV